MIRPYFPSVEGTPQPLRVEITRRVRFEEVDPLAIVWHGRYASYFEDARVALCDKYGIGYLTLHEQGIVAPVRKLHVDYLRPLRFGDVFTVEGILHWSDTARLNIEFIIRNSKREVTTTGYTVQMMLDPAGELMLFPPPFINEFRNRWSAGIPEVNQ